MMQKLLREGEKVDEKMNGGTSEDDLTMVGGAEDDELVSGGAEDDDLVSDDVIGGTAQLATGKLTLELTSSPQESLLGPLQTPLNPLEILSKSY
jgi:hypothetical protein